MSFKKELELRVEKFNFTHFRRAIPHCAEYSVIDIFKIYMTKDGSWEWFIYGSDGQGILRCLTYSPTTPAGEFGTVYTHELKDNPVIIQVSLPESLPPVGYKWDEKGVRKVARRTTSEVR